MIKDTSFFEKVYEVVRKIPGGRVSTYGHIADYLGSKGAARMVGWAMNVSHHTDPPVPAHRVVNRNGLLTGKIHFRTEDMMQKLLENEGLTICDDTVMNFEEVLWDPLKEL